MSEVERIIDNLRNTLVAGYAYDDNRMLSYSSIYGFSVFRIKNHERSSGKHYVTEMQALRLIERSM